MKIKNFLVGGIIGGIVDWLLGWLFYGILLKDFFPQPEESTTTMVYILLGCIFFGLFIAFIYTKWAQITTFATGAKGGAVLGLLLGIFYNFFNLAMMPGATYETFAVDVAVTTVMTTIVGGVIGAINGKLG